MSGVTVGIDPGATGAIALLDHTGQLLAVHDMPSHEGIVAAPLAAAILDQPGIVAAWVEDVHAMPKQGVSSSFKFGRALGTIVGVLGGLHIPTHYVTPHKWKKDAGLRSDKDASRRRATELWPAHADQFKLKKHTDRAEAALIARHGWATTPRNPEDLW